VGHHGDDPTVTTDARSDRILSKVENACSKVAPAPSWSRTRRWRTAW
jgi:hypothetical protein